MLTSNARNLIVLFTAALFVVWTTTLTPAIADAPPVFTKLTYQEALRQSKEKKNFVLVKATAAWCGPCKTMDKSTWRDERVVAWVQEHGHAVYLDVDKQEKLAQELGISAMPTMVLLKEGEEIDRVVGYRSADQMLTWLKDAAAGKTSKKALEESLAELKGGDPKMSMQERLSFVQALESSGKYDEASAQYEWLWKNILKHQESMYGVRLSFMASSIEQLASHHEPTKMRFEKIRDETELKLKQTPRSWEDMTDWVVLNEIVHDEDRTLAWIDRIKVDEDGRSTLNRMGHHIERVFIARERWKDLGEFWKSPRSEIEKEHQMLQMMTSHQENLDESAVKGMNDFAMHSFRDKVGMIVGTLLAADRIDQARVAVKRGIELDDTPEMRVVIVEWAIKTGSTKPEHADMLTKAAADATGDHQADLRERITKAKKKLESIKTSRE